MTCPRCHTEFESMRNICPECGVRVLRSVSGVVRTSAVLISAGKDRGFYNSVQEVPEPLRTQLIATTAGRNSGTIVIADRAGKEQLTRGIARRDARQESDEPAQQIAAGTAEEAPARRSLRILPDSWIAWVGVLIVLTLAAVICSLFGMRW